MEVIEKCKALADVLGGSHVQKVRKLSVRCRVSSCATRCNLRQPTPLSSRVCSHGDTRLSPHVSHPAASSNKLLVELVSDSLPGLAPSLYLVSGNSGG